MFGSEGNDLMSETDYEILDQPITDTQVTEGVSYEHRLKSM